MQWILENKEQIGIKVISLLIGIFLGSYLNIPVVIIISIAVALLLFLLVSACHAEGGSGIMLLVFYIFLTYPFAIATIAMWITLILDVGFDIVLFGHISSFFKFLFFR